MKVKLSITLNILAIIAVLGSIFFSNHLMMTELKVHDQKIDLLGNHLGIVTTKVDTLQDNVTSTLHLLTLADAKLQGLENDLSSLQSGVQNTQDEVRYISSNLQAGIKETQKKIEDTQVSLDALRKQVEELRVQVSAITLYRNSGGSGGGSVSSPIIVSVEETTSAPPFLIPSSGLGLVSQGSRVNISQPQIASAAFPSLNILPNGTWLTTFKVAKNIQSDKGSIYMCLSTDNGTSWSNPVLLFGDNGVHNYDEAELVIMLDKKIWAISSKVPTHGMVYKISDNGSTWSEEKSLPDVVAGGYPYALGNHFLTVNSTVFLPLYVWKDGSTNTNDIKAGVYRTNDNGTTWQFSFLDPAGWAGVAGSEAGIAYIGNNTLLAMWRYISGGQEVCRSWSYDMGNVWQKVEGLGTINGGKFPWLADVELTWFGNSLILTAATNVGNDATQGFSAWVSNDRGKTWGHQQTLIAEAIGEIGYHGIEYLGNDYGYIVYNSGDTTANASICGQMIKIVK